MKQMEHLKRVPMEVCNLKQSSPADTMVVGTWAMDSFHGHLHSPGTSVMVTNTNRHFTINQYVSLNNGSYYFIDYFTITYGSYYFSLKFNFGMIMGINMYHYFRPKR